MIKRHTFAALALTVTAFGGLTAPAWAHGNNDGNRHSDSERHSNRHHGHDEDHDHGHHGHHGAHDQSEPGVVSIAADNLNSPRQVIEHDGAIYVAEAGTGGATCVGEGEDQACIGLTGSVTRVKHGEASRVQTGLLSVASPEGEDVVGVNALTFKDDRLYGIASSTCEPLDGVPAEIAAQLGKVLRLRGGDRVRAVGDASTIECTTDPDGQGPDSNPYGIAAKGKSFYVADAGGNDIVKIRKGQTTVASVLSRTGQPVPTSLAFGPDGALYIGTLNFEGGPGGASVYRLDTHTGALSVYATGFTAITGLGFGRHGTLYVSQWSAGFGPTGPSPDGSVIAVPWGGGLEGRQTIGTGVLHFPGGVAYSNGAIYVSNWSIAAGVDGPAGPGVHGQLLKITV